MLLNEFNKLSALEQAKLKQVYPKADLFVTVLSYRLARTVIMLSIDGAPPVQKVLRTDWMNEVTVKNK